MEHTYIDGARLAEAVVNHEDPMKVAQSIWMEHPDDLSYRDRGWDQVDEPAEQLPADGLTANKLSRFWKFVRGLFR